MNRPFDQRKLTIDEWNDALRRVAKENGIVDMDVTGFSDYFDEGMTPEEAFEEDMSNG